MQSLQRSVLSKQYTDIHMHFKHNPEHNPNVQESQVNQPISSLNTLSSNVEFQVECNSADNGVPLAYKVDNRQAMESAPNTRSQMRKGSKHCRI